MKHRTFLAFAVLGGLLMLASTGCSVGMAMSGKHPPNLGAIRVGATRGEVELQLGSPRETAFLPDGRRTDVYEYELGNEPSAGRAAMHGIMDVLTLGIWEVVGTPIEALQGETKRLAITYTAEDTVAGIGSVQLPKVAETAPPSAPSAAPTY
jgi:hypothetical protein